MGITKILPVRDSALRVLGYIKNPEKTCWSGFRNVLHYVKNDSKVTFENEKTVFITGINCHYETAEQEVTSVQERFGKTTGIVAYHVIQSFKTGEVTPELCHRLGVELTQKMWGESYQAVVATHFNTGTYHNHIVVNAVDMWNGRKFKCNEGAYWRLRKYSDDLCRENGLTVIDRPAGKTPRKLYFAEKNGEPTRYNLMREAIDFAIGISRSRDEFLKVMRTKGYVFDFDGKYTTIRSLHSKKPVRVWHLGENYEPAMIDERIAQGDRYQKNDASYEFWGRRYAEKRRYPMHLFMRGSFTETKKISGLPGLYLCYCMLLGYPKREQQHRPLSPELREAWRHIDDITHEVDLIAREKLHTPEDVKSFIEESENQLSDTVKARNKIYNRLRRCADPEEITALKSRRDDCTAVLKSIRKDIKTAGRILERPPKMKEEIAAEKEMRQELRPPHRNKNQRRDYER